uniref:Uncharacterized protein n=1 Tax=Gouania willdenowi TaxID=441366 RepID=A0A8C5N0U5_GOUWI
MEVLVFWKNVASSCVLIYNNKCILHCVHTGCVTKCPYTRSRCKIFPVRTRSL